MKKMWMLLLAGTLLLATACEKEDDHKEVQWFKEAHPEVVEALMARYPAARIIDVDAQMGGVEVEIMDNGTRREVSYDADANWLRTKTDWRVSYLPSIVAQALADSAYGNYRVDEVDWIETPEGDFYLFELERGGAMEVILRIDPSGVIL